MKLKTVKNNVDQMVYPILVNITIEVGNIVEFNVFRNVPQHKLNLFDALR